MAHCDSYVICTSPRSGSTLLCKLLAATGVAGNPKSHFHDPSISEWLGYYGLKSDPTASEQEVLAAVFQAAIATGSSETGIFGLRLQRHSFDFFSQKLAVLHAGHGSDVERYRAAFGRTVFIHLTREDKVGQAISYEKAHQTGLWHMAPDGTELERLSPPRAPEYDGEKLKKHFDLLTGFDRDWNAWFAAENIQPYRIIYETLSENPIETLRQTLEFLGLEPNSADGVELGVAKLADDVNHDWAMRFRAEH